MKPDLCTELLIQSSKVSGEIVYPFPNFNGATVEVGNGQVISPHDEMTYTSPNVNGRTIELGNG